MLVTFQISLKEESERGCIKEMFCWGNTANGELGLGGIEDHHVHIPRELTFKDVNQVKYGTQFCLFILINTIVIIKTEQGISSYTIRLLYNLHLSNFKT